MRPENQTGQPRRLRRKIMRKNSLEPEDKAPTVRGEGQLPMYKLPHLFFCIVVLFPFLAMAQTLPDPEPIPPLPSPQPAGSVPLGDPKQFPEVKLTFPIAKDHTGRLWESIEQNYPGKELAWLREAKFGIWVHFRPAGCRPERRLVRAPYVYAG